MLPFLRRSRCFTGLCSELSGERLIRLRVTFTSKAALGAGVFVRSWDFANAAWLWGELPVDRQAGHGFE